MDTIEVNQDLAANLEFSEDIKEIVYGNNPFKVVNGKKLFTNYDEFRLDNKAIIVANGINPPLTTISVILEDGSLYYGYITYKEQPQKTHYEFKKEKKKENDKGGEVLVVKRLEELMKQPQKYYDFGKEKDRIEMVVTNMMNDENTTYIKVVINNKSSGKYTLTGLSFMHEEDKSKEAKKSDINIKDSDGDETKNKKRIQPVYEISPDEKEINAYSSKEFGFAIPLFTTGKGGLLIRSYEAEGTRAITIKIKANDIAKIDVFKD